MLQGFAHFDNGRGAFSWDLNVIYWEFIVIAIENNISWHFLISLISWWDYYYNIIHEFEIMIDSYINNDDSKTKLNPENYDFGR